MRMEKAKKFALIFKNRFLGTEVVNISVLIAYYLLLSLFPLLIALGNLLPFLGIQPTTVVTYLQPILPQPVQAVLLPIITNLLTGASGGLLSVGALAALWSSSRGVRYLQLGLNKAYGIPDRNHLVKRILSFLIVLLIMLLLGCFVLIYSLGELLLSFISPYIPAAESLFDSVSSLKWPVSLLFIFLLLLLVYRVVPDVKLRLKEVWVGAAFSTVSLLLLSEGFTIYIRFFTQRFSSYGALGTFFLLMFWLQFSAMLLLIGAIVNASMFEFRHGEALPQHSPVDDAIEKTRQGLRHRFARWRAERQRKADKDNSGPA